MSVTIRMARIGRKNLPAFKIVAATTRSKRNGIFLDTIGSYNPSEKPAHLSINKEKYQEWLGKGALVTPSVKKLVDGTYEFAAYPSAKKVKALQKKQAQQAEKNAPSQE